MKNRNLAAYCYLLPSAAALSVFMLYPMLQTLYLSFFKWNLIKPKKEFVFLDNYIEVLTSHITGRVLLNTAAYIGILLVINFAAPYVLSFVLSHVVQKCRGLYKSAMFLPSVISLVVGSIIFTWILNPVSGPIAYIAGWIGITLPIWTKTEGLVIVALSVITSWKVFGYNFIVILGGVAGVSAEAIEAARVDKVPLRRIFFDIVVPMSGSTGIYLFIITIVQGMQYVFTPVKVLTQGGPDYASSNLIYQSYHEAFTVYKTGTASAFSVLTMLIFAGLLYLEFRFVERGVHYEN